MGHLARTIARNKGQGYSGEGIKGICEYVCWGAG